MTRKPQPLVSIVVPVYGAEAYLPACIDSLRGQSYPHVEIVLVDDQSPDLCPQICDRYAALDSRVKVVHQENKGVSGARNTGLDHATGDYVSFVDSDDELLPQAVELMLRDALHHGADIVSAGQEIVSQNGGLIRSEGDGLCVLLQGDEFLLRSLSGDVSTVSSCGKLYRMSFLHDVRFEEGKNINEDGFFIFQCAAKSPLVVQHNVPVYRYTVRQGSFSTQSFSDGFLSMLYFCERKKEILEERFPRYREQAHNMEVRTNLEFLQVLCRTTDKKYRPVRRACVQTVRRLKKYHRPANKHHKRLASLVTWGLYPLYKAAVRFKYYR